MLTRETLAYGPPDRKGPINPLFYFFLRQASTLFQQGVFTAPLSPNIPFKHKGVKHLEGEMIGLE